LDARRAGQGGGGARTAIVFSSLGHLYVHLFTAFYFVIVLALEDDWQLPYHELIALWTLGSILVGAAALPAGMLSDRIGATRMMVVFFVGMGAAAMWAGFSDSPPSMTAALAGIGIFAAIYHPVGIPWLVRNAGAARGRALGVNGIFGSLGSAAAAITAGTLIDLVSWRAAFLVPGLVSLVTGVVLMWCASGGRLHDRRPPSRDADERHAPGARMRAFTVLMLCMLLASLVYHGTQIALPKLFETRHDGIVSAGTFGVGVLVAAVYTVAGLMQVVGGYFADRYPLKPVYLGAVVAQVPALWLASASGGWTLVLAATFMVMAAVASLPAENILLARYMPSRRHGLAFGLKFVVAFGAAPLAVQVVAFITGTGRDLGSLFGLLSLLALCAFLAATLLPPLRSLRALGAVGAGDD
jgi:MFS family permease